MNKFEKRMKDELNSVTPDLKEKIKQNAAILPVKKEKSVRAKWAVMPIMAVVVLLIAIITPVLVLNPKGDGNTPVLNNYSMVMSINPDIEIKYNSKGKVTAVRGLNKDGIMLIYGKNMVGEDVNQVSSKLLNRMKTLGYLKGDGDVKITVVDEKGKFNDKQYGIITNNVEQILKREGVNKSINKMTKEELDRIEDEIENNAEAYLSVFKEEIDALVKEMKGSIEGVIDGVIGIVKDVEPSVNITKFNKKTVKNLEDLFDSESPLTTKVDVNKLSAVFESVKKYGEEYEDDYIEDFNLNAETCTFEDFYELLEELADDYDKIISIERDLNLGVVPDDLDDLIKIILSRKTR